MSRPSEDVRAQRVSPSDPRFRVKYFGHDGWITIPVTSSAENAKEFARRNKDTLLARKEKDLSFGLLARDFFAVDGAWNKDQIAHGWKRTDSTLYSYTIFLQNLFMPTWKTCDIRFITSSQINTALMGFEKTPEKLTLDERGKGPVRYALASLNKMRHALSLMYDYWIQEGIVKENPVKAVGRFNDEPEHPRDAIPQGYRKLLRPETHEEALALYDFPIYTALFFLMDDTGARPGELRALRWGQVDWKRRFIPIRQAIEGGKRDKVKSTKTRLWRPAYFTERTKAELLAWRAASKHADDMDFIFIAHGRDKPIASNTALYALRRALKKLGIPEKQWAPYNFRHTTATRLKGTLTQVEIGTILGHTNESTTLGYQHPDDEILYQSGAKIKRKLDKSEE